MDLEDMEMEMEMVMVLEKKLDLHDEVNDSIHAISRSHFLQSVKAFDKTSPEMKQGEVEVSGEGVHGSCYSRFSGSDATPMVEARSLNDIRAALEGLEDQFEFFILNSKQDPMQH
ncbi:hypothetical protein IHE45_05G116600 [Dioscorea alata]|uniref:Uncharacterized protein n=1 Tax=Dioscorea alata TaxID=55571 RepID=A0ACB7W3Z9_DIOAL|nr:hypothetical protein IHE45_05G116600 [Dioscorea alata]